MLRQRKDVPSLYTERGWAGMRFAVCVVVLWVVSCWPVRVVLADLVGCPSSATPVKDGIGRVVCACVGDNTACVSGDTKCITAFRANVSAKALKHSEMIKEKWPVVVSPSMTSVFPFPNKLQGFRPTCMGCSCAEPCKRVVFVVGCGHSGTTYLTRLIASHPAYTAVMAETGWFSTYGGTRVAFESFRRESIACGQSGARVLVEKTPKHIHHLKEILEFFPTSKVVMIYRDGRDVTLSLAKRFQYSLNSLSGICMAASRWVVDNKVAEQYLSDPRVIAVRYEHLVAKPHDAINNIFFALEGTAAPHEVHAQFNQSGNLTWARLDPVREKPKDGPQTDTTRGVAGLESRPYQNKYLRNWQANQPLFDGSNKWVKELTSSQLRRLYKCPGFESLMRKLGYLNGTR